MATARPSSSWARAEFGHCASGHRSTKEEARKSTDGRRTGAKKARRQDRRLSFGVERLFYSWDTGWVGGTWPARVMGMRYPRSKPGQHGQRTHEHTRMYRASTRRPGRQAERTCLPLSLWRYGGAQWLRSVVRETCPGLLVGYRFDTRIWELAARFHASVLPFCPFFASCMSMS